MSKETDIAISVSVTNGPKMEPQKTKLPKDYCATNVIKAINEEVVITGENCHEKNHWVDLTLGDDRELVFVAIHADRYKYKDPCGKELPGIRYADSKEKLEQDPMRDPKCDPSKAEFLDGPHVYVSRLLQPLDVTKLYFEVCKELFTCVTEPEKKRVVINVTYGIGKCNEMMCPPCEPCMPPVAAGKKGH